MYCVSIAHMHLCIACSCILWSFDSTIAYINIILAIVGSFVVAPQLRLLCDKFYYWYCLRQGVSSLLMMSMYIAMTMKRVYLHNLELFSHLHNSVCYPHNFQCRIIRQYTWKCWVVDRCIARGYNVRRHLCICFRSAFP